jgi:putative lumazine-binding protein
MSQVRRMTAMAGAVLVTITAGGAMAAEEERRAIESVIRTAYIEGVHVKGDPALMRKGFHPDFRMFMLKDGALTTITLDEWAGRIEKAAKERTGPAPQIRAEFPLVDITNNEAVARVEVHRDGKHIFTDYLSLYKFADGWKIVGKIFQSRS